MESQFRQPKQVINVEVNKQSIARNFGIGDNEVCYAKPGQPLTGYKVIYDKATQRAYYLPTGLTGTVVSMSIAGVLTHSAGTVDLGALAVTREEFVTLPGSFSSGSTINVKNERLEYQGGLYRWDGSLPKYVPAGSTPAGSGGVGIGAWLSVGDAALRQELLRKRVYAVDFGDIPDAAHPDIATTTIQTAIEYVYANGGGVVDLGPFSWKVAASTLNETYDNYGVPVSSSTGCIILRKGVSLVGQAGKTKLFTLNKFATLIYMIAPEGNEVSGIELDGGWNPGDAGGNNGIFTLGTQGGADISCERVTFSDLYIHNVASYGLALQNGNPKGVSIDRIRVDNIGADALDLKARGGLVSLARGNNVSNVWASRYGQRVDGSSAIDVRGIWNLKGITATDFGGDSTKNYVGVRFRTKPVPSDPQQVADKSTLTGFTIIPTPGSAAASISGIECGSDDTHISNGYVEDCTHSVIYFGNANGSAIRGTVTDVTSVNARQYGFRSVAGTQGIIFKGCVDVGAATAGFRIEGDNCNADVCVGTLSVSSGALPTFQQSGCRFGASWVVTERQNDTSVSVTAKGTATDISLRLSVKGSGFIGTNADIRPDLANTRYLGSNALPWAGGFTQTALTITSGAKFKTGPLDITDDMLDAADECPPIQYQLLDRVAEKGPDGARWHFGTIAERLEEAFTRHGLDVRRYAFFCEDHVPYSPAVIDEGTGEILEPEQKEEIRLGVRYEELLMLEAALQRRNYARLLAGQEAMAARIEKLESLLSKAN